MARQKKFFILCISCLILVKEYIQCAFQKERKKTIKSIIRENSKVYIYTGKKMYHLEMEDIIYVEHYSRTVSMHTQKGIVNIPYISLQRIFHILGDDYLLQCHRSFLVNRIYIEEIDRTSNFIILKNYMGKVALGRKYKYSLLRRMHYVQ